MAKCPSCKVDLGDATSLIASRLVEKVKHECENDSYEELLNLPQLESHKEVCALSWQWTQVQTRVAVPQGHGACERLRIHGASNSEQ